MVDKLFQAHWVVFCHRPGVSERHHSSFQCTILDSCAAVACGRTYSGCSRFCSREQTSICTGSQLLLCVVLLTSRERSSTCASSGWAQQVACARFLPPAVNIMSCASTLLRTQGNGALDRSFVTCFLSNEITPDVPHLVP